MSVVLFSMSLYGQHNRIKVDSPDVRTKGLLAPYAAKSFKQSDSLYLKEKLKAPGFQKTIQPDSLKLSLDLTEDSLKNKMPRDSNARSANARKNSAMAQLKKIVPHGNVSVGYDYGFLPYTTGPAPASAAKVEGLLETDVCNIPIDVVFFYTNQKNLIGLNNYFRVSYNAERYKEKLNHKLVNNLDGYKTSLTGMNGRKQQLMQRMAYMDYLSSTSPDKWPTDSLVNKNINTSAVKMDTSGLFSIPVHVDTAGIASEIKDSLKTNSACQKGDSLKRQALIYKHKTDSVTKLYQKYKSQYANLNDSINKLQAKINGLEEANQNPAYGQTSPYLSKIQNFLSGVKKMDVGLCYPAYSTFLANNVPVRGINFEYQKNHFFFALTYGTTVSTLLYTNRNIDGFLKSVRNSYNYFDVNDLSSGRKILSVKLGAGEKEKDHFFVGCLAGKGVSPYFPATTESAQKNSIESNLVFEADIRRKLAKSTTLDIIGGKSSVQDEELNMTTLRTAAKEIFSNYRSYAFLVKLKTRIPATRSDLTFSTRWVDPFFNSFGTGFMRSDNIRYEARLDQPLGKSVRYSAALRYEEDNLLRLLNYKNTFYSINNTISYKIRKGLTVRVGYTPLVRTLRGENYRMSTTNSITTCILTFAPRRKNVQIQYSVLYNSYHVTTDTTPLNFQNFAYTHQFVFKGGFRTGLNLSWFKNSLRDSSGNDVLLAVLDAGYQFRNGSSFSVAGKSGYKNEKFYPGFIVRSSIKLSSYFFWENQIEKFIVGDFFNGYELEYLQKFPYCYSTKLILNF